VEPRKEVIEHVIAIKGISSSSKEYEIYVPRFIFSYSDVIS